MEGTYATQKIFNVSILNSNVTFNHPLLDIRHDVFLTFQSYSLSAPSMEKEIPVGFKVEALVPVSKVTLAAPETPLSHSIVN